MSQLGSHDRAPVGRTGDNAAPGQRGPEYGDASWHPATQRTLDLGLARSAALFEPLRKGSRSNASNGSLKGSRNRVLFNSLPLSDQRSYRDAYSPPRIGLFWAWEHLANRAP